MELINVLIKHIICSFTQNKIISVKYWFSNNSLDIKNSYLEMEESLKLLGNKRFDFH